MHIRNHSHINLDIYNVWTFTDIDEGPVIPPPGQPEPEGTPEPEIPATA